MPSVNLESVTEQPGAGFTHRLRRLDENGRVLHLSGRIGAADVEPFRDLIDRVVQEAAVPRLVLDCAGLRALSGTAIGLFAILQRRLRLRGGELVLLHLPEAEREPFRLLGFADLFTVAADLDEAAACLSSPDQAAPTALFPHVLECPACTTRLRAVKSGRFRCSICQAVLAINNGAQVFAA